MPGNPGQCKPGKAGDDNCPMCQTHGGSQATFLQEWMRQCNARGVGSCTENMAKNRFNAVCKTSGTSAVAAPGVGR